MALKDFEDVFDHIGGFGPFQYIPFGIFCVYNIFFAFGIFGQMFLTLTPPHHCAPPPEVSQDSLAMLGFNLTDEAIKRLTIPTISEDFDEYSQCEIYDADFLQILRENLAWPNSSWSRVPCQHGWFYDFSYYYPSITSDLDWVCEKDSYPTLAQSAFFMGGLVGGIVFGWLADSFGRLPCIVVTTLISGIFGLSSVFATTFTTFCILRFIVGSTLQPQFYTMYILAIEYVSSRYRTFVANFPIGAFLTTGLMVLPWLAYGLHNWRWLGVVMSAPKLLVIFLPWFVPESIRWLIGKGKVEKSVNILENAARRNKKFLTTKFMDEFKEFAARFNAEKDIKVNWYHLLKTPTLRKRFLVLCVVWICVAVSHDAQARQAEQIEYDFFITFTLLGFVEAPADVVTMLMMETVGRVHTTAWPLLASGTVTLSLALIQNGNPVVVAVLLMSGRFFVTMSYNVIIQHVMEILPTVGRAQGSGMIQTLGIAMTFISPLIVYSSKFGLWIPFTIITVLCGVGAFMDYFLPETLRQTLPDTLEEGENAFRNQPLCYFPCLKKEKAPEKEPNTNIENGRYANGIPNPAFDEEDTHF